MASGTIVHGAAENMNTLFKRVTYNYAWPSSFTLAANGSKSIKGSDFGFSVPSGYTVAGIGRIYTGTVHAQISGLNPAVSGDSGAMTIRNLTSTAQTGKTSTFEVIYIRSSPFF